MPGPTGPPRGGHWAAGPRTTSRLFRLPGTNGRAPVPRVYQCEWHHLLLFFSFFPPFLSVLYLFLLPFWPLHTPPLPSFPLPSFFLLPTNSHQHDGNRTVPKNSSAGISSRPPPCRATTAARSSPPPAPAPPPAATTRALLTNINSSSNNNNHLHCRSNPKPAVPGPATTTRGRTNPFHELLKTLEGRRRLTRTRRTRTGEETRAGAAACGPGARAFSNSDLARADMAIAAWAKVEIRRTLRNRIEVEHLLPSAPNKCGGSALRVDACQTP